MSRFSELGQNKTTILLRLIEDERIVKCLVNNQLNFLDTPISSNFDITSLIYSQIFPYRFVPQIQTEPKTFITMKFNYKPNGDTYKYGSIVFYLFTHNSLLTTDYGSLRYDLLLNYIDESFNSTRGLGFGKLSFYDMDDILINENFSGIYIAYKLLEKQ